MCMVKIPYVEKDGIYYPVLVIPKDEKLSSVGKYGLLWLSYMKENHAGRLKTLRRLGSANRTAVQVNEEAYEMLDVIMNRYISNHTPDNRNSTMELWKIREQAVLIAEETVLGDIVYRYR